MVSREKEYKVINEAASERIDQYNKLLDAQVALSHLTTSLKEAREAVWKVLSYDLQITASEHLEARLWSAHAALNRRFRQDSQKQHITKTAGLSKNFLTFIKSSQTYYRDHARFLNQRYELTELDSLGLDLPIVKHDSPNNGRLPEELRACVLCSCYNCLIALGDLSRWREQLLPRTPPDWKPARGYYYLAASICPELGLHHNQLALTFEAEEDYLNTLYHLFRSYSIQANDSAVAVRLRRGIEKTALTIKSSMTGDLAQVLGHQDGSDIAVLAAASLKAYSACFSDKHSDECLLDTNEKCFRAFLLTSNCNECGHVTNIFCSRMIIMTISAERYKPLCRHINVRFSAILFETLANEIESAQGVIDGLEDPVSFAKRLLLRAAHLLRPIRIYSLWMLKNCEALAKDLGDIDTQKAWTSFARLLTILANRVQVKNLPTVDYLLEYDQETMGFLPLICKKTERIWKNGEAYKLANHEGISKLTPEMEVLVCVRDLLINGLELTSDERMPLHLDRTTFTFRAKANP